MWGLEIPDVALSLVHHHDRLAVGLAPPGLLRRAVGHDVQGFYVQHCGATQPRGANRLVADPLHTLVPCRIGHRLGREIGQSRYQTISVEGHTDRLGSTEYNQTLSEERAESVKNYLVTSGNIDPTRISAVGKSETQPVTAAGDCPDSQARSALISCLQPDRRVEVEVTGTR